MERYGILLIHKPNTVRTMRKDQFKPVPFNEIHIGDFIGTATRTGGLAIVLVIKTSPAKGIVMMSDDPDHRNITLKATRIVVVDFAIHSEAIVDKVVDPTLVMMLQMLLVLAGDIIGKMDLLNRMDTIGKISLS